MEYTVFWNSVSELPNTESKGWTLLTQMQDLSLLSHLHFFPTPASFWGNMLKILISDNNLRFPLPPWICKWIPRLYSPSPFASSLFLITMEYNKHNMKIIFSVNLTLDSLFRICWPHVYSIEDALHTGMIVWGVPCTLFWSVLPKPADLLYI